MENRTNRSIDLSRNEAFRIGGISAILLAGCYILITGLYTFGGVLTGGVEGWLAHLAGHTTAWWGILYLSVLTDLLFLPVTWALYHALQKRNQNAVLAGAAFLVLFVFLDLAVTWPNYAALIQLGGKYSAAIDEIQRVAVITSASIPFEVLSSGLFGVYAILAPSLGILIFGIIMLKSDFGRIAAWLGIVTGILGVISVFGPLLVPSLGMAAVLTSVFTLVWFVFVGLALIRQSKSMPDPIKR